MDSRHRRQTADDTVRLDSEGNWYQGEYPILHDRTVQFLHRNIAVDADGRYYLTGEDKPIYFKVEDVPYWVAKVERTIAGYLITLTDGSIELLNFDTLWSPKKGTLYCLVKGNIPAKFQRGPTTEVSKDLQQKGKKWSLIFGGKRYAVAPVPSKEAILPRGPRTVAKAGGKTTKKKQGKSRVRKKTARHAKRLKKAAKKSRRR